MNRDKEHLLDILEAAKLAISYVKGKTKETFLGDIQCQDAVIRRLEIIGEAAGRVSKETMGAIPSLPWQEMRGMRNMLIHEYGDVDLNIIWDTMRIDLPPLVETLEKEGLLLNDS